MTDYLVFIPNRHHLTSKACQVNSIKKEMGNIVNCFVIF
uniref:Uncharacterized protein n=1 Tax=Lepeophtheirus salmonis TaxID=72036 RepID=A0A0K2SX67_LEPSM